MADETFKEAMRIGAVGYIKKPFTSTELDI